MVSHKDAVKIYMLILSTEWRSSVCQCTSSTREGQISRGTLDSAMMSIVRSQNSMLTMSRQT